MQAILDTFWLAIALTGKGVMAGLHYAAIIAVCSIGVIPWCFILRGWLGPVKITVAPPLRLIYDNKTVDLPTSAGNLSFGEGNTPNV